MQVLAALIQHNIADRFYKILIERKEIEELGGEYALPIPWQSTVGDWAIAIEKLVEKGVVILLAAYLVCLFPPSVRTSGGGPSTQQPPSPSPSSTPDTTQT